AHPRRVEPLDRPAVRLHQSVPAGHLSRPPMPGEPGCVHTGIGMGRGSVLGGRDAGSIVRTWRGPRPHRTLRVLALVATGLTFVLIAVGALVRDRKSGV